MKPIIPFTDWEKIDLRVGTILDVEDHPKADKLYVMKIDFNTEQRTIVAGLKAHYTKSELKGKQGIFIVNLESATLRGIESQGMTLAAVSDDETLVCILSPEKKIPNGSIIR
ncbi:MAG: hypothetical protein AABW79_03760 [Nanoarchaeota archaeon]